MSLTSQRPDPAGRCFASDAVEDVIRDVASRVADAELAWLFSNCFPNTLDTTVTLDRDAAGQPNAFIITGDIPAMWLRDSTNQVWPYLQLTTRDPGLKDLLRGVIRRQVRCVLLDPYANAFYRADEVGEWKGDLTAMRPGVHERKYELDSLCAVLRLSCGYFRETGDSTPFDADWIRAVELILDTIRHEQQGSDEQPDMRYTFRRRTAAASDTLPNRGRGTPFRRTGMSRSPFRPSDDAGTFQFLVPANAMAAAGLRDLGRTLDELTLSPPLARESLRLADEILQGIKRHAILTHRDFGPIFAYEVDGFGSFHFMDDANVPSLLSLPYLGFCEADDPVYRATRAFVLGPSNPWFFRGAAAAGVGGPHIGEGWIWPMSIIMRAITSVDDAEILECLRMLKSTHAGTGFMHESFWKDDPGRHTRRWFAWANSLFGELILKLQRERPHLLSRPVQPIP